MGTRNDDFAFDVMVGPDAVLIVQFRRDGNAPAGAPRSCQANVACHQSVIVTCSDAPPGTTVEVENPAFGDWTFVGALGAEVALPPRGSDVSHYRACVANQFGWTCCAPIDIALSQDRPLALPASCPVTPGDTGGPRAPTHCHRGLYGKLVCTALVQ